MTMMSLVSTRTAATASPFEAVLCGLAPDGGLYVPASLPTWTLSQIQDLVGLPYEKAAALILHGFFDEISQEKMEALCAEAYASFSDERRVPVSSIEPGLFAMELYHGPTLAFKDVALQLLPLLMAYSAKATGQKEKSLILVATSGDTGKAALEGFADKPDTAIVVCYPNNGVSPAQKLQMVTQKGGNVCVTAVEGNFDDCQNGVKRLMGDPDFHEMVRQNGYTITSANSINFGRLVPQIAYYFTSYAQLLEQGAIALGEAVDFIVPTGNFGDILAGWYAKKMGLPVGTLICASNKNNVLSRFFETGTYDCGGELYKTTSPSMDILISSNLERLLFELTGQNPAPIQAWMEQRTAEKKFTVDEKTMEKARQVFFAAWADDQAASEAIGTVFHAQHVLLDPHSAVGYCAYQQYKKTKDTKRKAVLLCTASPYKFAATVLEALGRKAEGQEQTARALEKATGKPVPQAILDLFSAEQRHFSCVEPKELDALVESFLKQS